MKKINFYLTHYEKKVTSSLTKKRITLATSLALMINLLSPYLTKGLLDAPINFVISGQNNVFEETHDEFLYQTKDEKSEFFRAKFGDREDLTKHRIQLEQEDKTLEWLFIEPNPTLLNSTDDITSPTPSPITQQTSNIIPTGLSTLSPTLTPTPTSTPPPIISLTPTTTGTTSPISFTTITPTPSLTIRLDLVPSPTTTPTLTQLPTSTPTTMLTPIPTPNPQTVIEESKLPETEPKQDQRISLWEKGLPKPVYAKLPVNKGRTELDFDNLTTRVINREVGPGIDITYEKKEEDQLEERIILKEQKELTSLIQDRDSQFQLQFNLKLKNLVPNRDEAGNWSFRAKDDNSDVFTITTPTLQDAAGATASAQIELTNPNAAPSPTRQSFTPQSLLPPSG